MEDPFAALPWDQLSVVRIMVKMMDATENPVQPWRRFRADLRSVLAEHLPDSIVRGYAEIAGNHAHAGFRSFPAHRVGTLIRATGFANQPCFNLHGNFVMSHPGYTRSDVTAIFSHAFPGDDAFWISEPMETRTDDHGFVWGGLAGWGEYSGFELKPLNFLARQDYSVPDEDYDPYAPFEHDNTYVAQVRLRMLQQLSRPKRNFKYRDDEDCIVDHITRAWVIKAEDIEFVSNDVNDDPSNLSSVDSTDVAAHDGGFTDNDVRGADQVTADRSTGLDRSIAGSDATRETFDRDYTINLVRDTDASTLVLNLSHQGEYWRVADRTDGHGWVTGQSFTRPAQTLFEEGFSVVKSLCASRWKYPMKTMTLNCQIQGFCMRPGIDKPPWHFRVLGLNSWVFMGTRPYNSPTGAWVLVKFRMIGG